MFFSNNLLDLILPLVNLSVVDGNKGVYFNARALSLCLCHIEIIGENLIAVFLDIIKLEEDKPMVHEISGFIKQGKREASKVYFVLFYLFRLYFFS
jgi:hypothetical protein